MNTITHWIGGKPASGSHIHGPEGVAFYSRAKVVTSRWPRGAAASEASYHFPTHK